MGMMKYKGKKGCGLRFIWVADDAVKRGKETWWSRVRERI